jgi:hypothetical protein
MKKTIYIATVGTETKTQKPNLGPLVSGLLNIAPQRIEKACMLMDRDDPESVSIINQQFPYLKQKIEVVKIDSFDYESLLEAILKIHASIPKDTNDIVVNVTGGTKVMTLGAFMGAVLVGAQVQYVKEAKGAVGNPEIFDIKMPQVPVYEMHQIQKLIITILKKEAKTDGMIQSEIRRKIVEDYTGKKVISVGTKKETSPQLISYHCDILERNGLITREHDEENRRVQILKLTRIGSILANFIMISK